MAEYGYYRHPAIHGDRIVFVSEDDLWAVSSEGGVASRLTANPGSQTRPRFSPDGGQVAFVSRDEGRLDVHVMESDGGSPRRVSHLGSSTETVGWTPDGARVVVATDYRQPFAGWRHLWTVPVDGSAPEPLAIGPAFSASFAPNGDAIVIGRNQFDPARWKRYRGGRAGVLWVDRHGDGEFEVLISLQGNMADPMWIGRRIYFLSDHEGVGNVYSVTPTGRGLTRHTDHADFYARFASTDGRRIVYHAGADLWVYDPREDATRRIDVRVASARPQRNRRFTEPKQFLESADLHPKGHSLALTVRGGAYSFGLWEGAVHRHGTSSGHRERLATWLPDGARLVSVSDASGEERLIVTPADGSGDPEVLDADLGRVRSIDPAPAGDRLALTNHRHDVIIVDLARGSATTIHRSPYYWIAGTSWSPDGRWLAFSAADTRTTMSLFLYDTSDGSLHRIGETDTVDYAPSFDPDGKYLYFLSSRMFEPIYDTIFHDYGFPRSTIPMLLPLSASTPSPFDPAMKEVRAPGAPAGGSSEATKKKQEEGEDAAVPVEIDLEGLADRARPFPMPVARYVRIHGAKGRALIESRPLVPAAAWSATDVPKGRLEAYDFATERVESVADGISGVGVSGDGTTMVLRVGHKLRVVPAAWKDDKNGKDEPGRETGWIDLARVRVEVVPGEEWRQMFSEAWRLQRDHFWFEDMSGVDWRSIHDRYLGLVDRVASRAEFSDLMWEMQGELGTSHAYELGGDYRPEPAWSLGSLGADVTWRRGAWRIDRIPRGDAEDPKARSPLAEPGLQIAEGDRILTVDGVALDRTTAPDELLVDRASRPVELTIARGRRRPRTVTVTPLASETALRYRDWVRENRRRVREATDGRVGYIHIPDMGPAGFAEFHRSWRAEVDFEGLVVDVRFNRGGNVSHLLMQKLARRRLGFRIARWQAPRPFPNDAPAGPMVALTNEFAGSDGDIFSHSFKMLGLGPLVGTRTWGGVVGIWPQQALVDGTRTTQPEFGTWFSDVGYEVENYGTDPDVEVVITPQDYAAGRDPQLERGVAMLLDLIDESEPLFPDFGPAPRVAPPVLDG